MKVRISYSQIQLENAIDFISKNNQSFLNKDEEISDAIKEHIVKLAEDSTLNSIEIMGFILIADREFESLDSDENVCRVQIYVDPALHLISEMDESDVQDQMIDVPIEKLYQ